MAYIETEDGYVNLATAQRAFVTNLGEYFIIDQAGERYKVECIDHLGVALATIVPAAGNFTLHQLWCPSAADDRVVFDSYPIIGWRIGQGLTLAEPIVAGRRRPLHTEDPEQSMTIIEVGDNGICIDAAGDAPSYKSFRDARAALVARCRKIAAPL